MTILLNGEFDPMKIAESGQCFRALCLPDGSFRFTAGCRVLFLRMTAENTAEVSCTEAEWRDFWADYFDLARDYTAVRALAQNDPYIGEAASFSRGLRLLRQDPWETLVSFILSQRKSIPAIRSCIEALCRRCGEPVGTPGGTVYGFPAPDALAALTEAELRECALGYRAPYVRDAALRAASGKLDFSALSALGDEDLLAALTEVKGVGIKVASCTALFAFGRTALAPVDTWIRKVIDERYGGSNPFPAFGDSAGILQQYVFYHTLKHKRDFGRN